MNFKIILILLCLFIGACKTTNEEITDKPGESSQSLENQKHSNLSIKYTKWSSWCEKIMKFRHCWLSGLCLAFMTYVSLFHFSCNPWHLRRLLVCLKVISEQYNLKNCHQTKILKIDHCIKVSLLSLSK